MKKVTIDLPSMYGDHHVQEVRRLLFDLDGVEEVFASSAFHLAEVSFNEAKVDQAQIETALSEAGYLGEMTIGGKPEKVSKGRKKMKIAAGENDLGEIVLDAKLFE